MSTLTAPRFVLLQSSTSTTQYFYLVLMDLPADTTKYPNPSSIVPVLNGTELSYTTNDYELPENYTGATITYLLKPYSVVSNEGIPNIQNITFNAKTSKKKGDTGGVTTKQLDGGITPVYYILKDRVFVIQSDTNTETYFVGGLVDYPSDVNIGVNLHLVNTNEYEVSRVAEANSALTCLAYSSNPVTYNPPTDENPVASASIVAIFVNGYNTRERKGILLFGDANLFANATQPDYGLNTNTL